VDDGARRRVRLADARLYLCCGPRPYEWLAAVTGAGVDVIQLRDKVLEAGPLCRAAAAFRRAADATGALFVMNDRPDVAIATGADGVHLGQDDLPLDVARSILGAGSVIGRSTHDPVQMKAATTEDCDYFCTGPVWATPTKEGRPAVGLGLVEEAAASGTGIPWFAIGGIDEDRVAGVAPAGATRIVVVRAITEAEDPVAAVRRLRSKLPS
jgi:thiamine-phosphate pyrophosphorylase